MKFLYRFIGLAILAVALFYAALAFDVIGVPPGPGGIEGKTLPADAVAARAADQAQERNQILFGDMHVHTTYSTDAFMFSLPLNNGSGAHPIGAACDYARYCSALDFWAITDHASALTPRKWAETRESMRACEALSDPQNPDLISLTGFEWTQVGDTVENHYGHKNVIFRGLADDQLVKKPIGAGGLAALAMRELIPEMPAIVSLLEFPNFQHYQDMNAFLREVRAMRQCDDASPRESWPVDCYEEANDPGDLVRRLEAQGFHPLLIPHGTTWGLYTPAGTTLDKQLKPEMRPESFAMIEVMSGHGNSEEYRPWRAATVADDGTRRCPEPVEGFLPQCWQAGEVIRRRCESEGGKNCDERASFARDAFLEMGPAGLASVPGADYLDWLDSDQCRDCFLPSFSYRPGGSVQYGLALTNFSKGAKTRFRWAFIAASDTHTARPGTGYKPVDRQNTTEANGPSTAMWAKLMNGSVERSSQPVLATQQELIDSGAGMNLADFERQSSFFTTGGLAAVHVTERNRDGLWQGLDGRNVYGTSGQRTMLWFDLQNADGTSLPMGSETAQTDTPHFSVRAVGSFKQKPGCPDYAVQGLGRDRLAKLCANECYNPSDERRRVTRIEVVRIRPQAYEGEPVENLIEDPWRVFPCDDTGEGCEVRISDNSFPTAKRDTVYYVRAIEEPSLQINGANLRCERDSDGNCIKPNPCFGDYRTDRAEPCALPIEHRAWSSPIFVDYGG
ncbi:MAG: DUF3604 domain-containing protein [Alphaproteobacteria bacterium]